MENMVKLHSATLSDPFSIFTSLSNGCILLLAMPFFHLFSHHPRQTPSLGPFIAELVPHQIQVLQGGVLFEVFGQGLT